MVMYSFRNFNDAAGTPIVIEVQSLATWAGLSNTFMVVGHYVSFAVSNWDSCSAGGLKIDSIHAGMSAME
jgi:hypothetical protein